MFGSSLDFSSVTLPGAGGAINASNAVSSDQLEKMNKSGKKWGVSPDGGISMHNEAILQANTARRERTTELVNREYNENIDGTAAMKEIFDRKKARMSAFREMKKEQYKFAEGDFDSELISMPLPGGAFKEKCSCNHCPACVNKKQKDQEYREWSTEARKKLAAGEMTGGFAGPDQSFPIASPVDVAAAWASVGRAANPRSTMAKIISLAKKHGWESGLPESVKKRLASGESGLPTE